MIGSSDVTTRLVTALEKLKTTYVVPDDKIPYRWMIPSIARQLTLMQRRDRSFKGVKEAQKELVKLSADAKSLSSRIKTLLIPQEPPYLEGTDLEAQNLALTAQGLLGLAGIIQAINLEGPLIEFADAAQTAAMAKAAPPGKPGRPPAAAATRVGLYLYQEYERVTGKCPTLTVRDNRASGPFFDLVKAVFDALGIKAKPEPTVRRVMEEMKIQRP
jgi:hypothetical protein